MLLNSRRKFIGQLGLGSRAISLPIGCANKQSEINARTDSPIHYRTIVEISETIKSKEISSVELTQLILDRIETHDGRLNSFITVMKKSDPARAMELDKELASGEYRGPLHGVPITVKDLIY